MIDIFKNKIEMASELKKDVFDFADTPYKLRNQSKCSQSISFTERCGIEIAYFMGPKVWDQVTTVKNSKSIEKLGVRIKI